MSIIEKGLWDGISCIENETVRMEESLAVFEEALHYFDEDISFESYQAKYFIEISLPQVRNLLFVTFRLLREIQPNMEKAIQMLHGAGKGINE